MVGGSAYAGLVDGMPAEVDGGVVDDGVGGRGLDDVRAGLCVALLRGCDACRRGGCGVVGVGVDDVARAAGWFAGCGCRGASADGGGESRDEAVFVVGVGVQVAVVVFEAALGTLRAVGDEGVGDGGPVGDGREDTSFELLQLADVVLSDVSLTSDTRGGNVQSSRTNAIYRSSRIQTF